MDEINFIAILVGIFQEPAFFYVLEPYHQQHRYAVAKECVGIVSNVYQYTFHFQAL